MKIILNNQNIKIIEKVTTDIKIKNEEIIGFNEKENIYISMKGNEVIQPGECILGNYLLRFLNRKDKITLEDINEEKIIIKQGKREIESFDDENSNLKDIELPKEKLFTITEEALEQIYEVKYAVAKDETRPILQTVHIDNENIVALDGYRLAIRKHNIKDIEDDLNIPYSVFRIAAKLKIKGDLDVYKDNFFIYLTNGTITLKVRQIEGEFIKYKCLLPKENKGKVILRQKELIGLLKSYKGFDDVRLHIDNNELELTVGVNTNMIIKDRLWCNIEGEVENIAFNPKYLIESVNCYEEIISFKVVSSISPMVIEQGNRYDLVLPVRIRK
ncbi:MAG: DNA polymerase III subunit beta [Clostridium chrysemydis]|uniref:DNA polymerase III subunit beta n=1 Tax=Clostridium chrysemydis TaxID=2665504 RepID=UPI003F2C9937